MDDDLSAWDDLTLDLIPSTGENCRSWLSARRDLFDPLPEYPIVVHESLEAAAASDLLDNELVITVDYASFTREELLKSFERLLVEVGHPAKLKTGPKSQDVRQRAQYQPNRNFEVEKYWEALKVWRVEVRYPDYTDEKLASFFPNRKRRPGHADDDTVDADVRWIQRAKSDARRALEGVRLGRFPDPDYLPNGLPDPERTPSAKLR